MNQSRPVLRAFTLIELLVVVAIIALLISILLPSLQNARDQARAVQCASNLHHVGQAFAIYLSENNATYPASYIYCDGPSGSYDPRNQPTSKEFGYLHWSYLLYNQGETDDTAFTCPKFINGGVPRTNPGLEEDEWEGDEQVNDFGQTYESRNALKDFQAPRLAFTVNAAIVPRNKFSKEISPGPRLNKYVKEHEINTSRNVILGAELHNNWIGMAEQQSSGRFKAKSHRPITPFAHISSGAGNGVYMTFPWTGGFIYGGRDEGNESEDFGLVPYDTMKDRAGLVLGELNTEVQVVGRHHGQGDKFGGTANFLYIDGAVARKTIHQTLKQQEWGDRFYSITGNNEVRAQW